MKYLLMAVLIAVPAWAVEVKPQPQPPLRVDPQTLVERAPDVQQVVVEVMLGKGMENPQWSMSFTTMGVWLDKLQGKVEAPVNEDILRAADVPTSPYKGLKVRMQTVDGDKFEELHVYDGRVSAPGGALIRPDPGRGLEYWLFSTARVRRDLMLGAQLVPVVDFEQCRLLGMQIVETEPRQCLMPDNSILLETDDEATKESLKIHDFDGCLHHGKALIASFPRRCVVAGGRVFTEPPRVPEEAPADAPLATGTSSTIKVPSGATMVSPAEAVSPVTVDNTLGSYTVEEAVSRTYPLSASVPVSAAAMPVPDVEPAAGPLPDYRELGWWDRLKLQWRRMWE